MISLSDDDVFKDLLERLEISIIDLSQVADDFLRFDAEYYSHENLKFQKIVSSVSGHTIENLGVVLDCSAFYPSITGYYSGNRELVPFLRVNEISNGLVVLTEDTVFLPQKVLDDNSKTITSVFPGDIIIAKGGNTLAKVGLETNEYPKYATCRDVIVLRTNSININKYFLWTFLHSKYGQGMMWRAATQTGQPHLTLPAISNLHIPEFSKNIQDKCEELYEASVSCKLRAQVFYADAAKLLTHELKLDAWKPSREQISVRSFKDIQNAKRMDAEYYQPKYDELFCLLSALPTKPLGEIVSIKKSIEPGSEFYGEDGVPFIRVSDVSVIGIENPSIRIPKTTVPFIENLYPKKDTILFSKDGSLGVAYKVENDIKAVTSSALLHLTVNDPLEVLPDYLTLVLNSPIVQMQAERDASGVIIKHWKLSEIASVQIPILEKSIQCEISNKVQESFSLRRQSERLLTNAKHTVEIAIEKDEAAATEYLDAI